MMNQALVEIVLRDEHDKPFKNINDNSFVLEDATIKVF